jgi:hypothetical protein
MMNGQITTCHVMRCPREQGPTPCPRLTSLTTMAVPSSFHDTIDCVAGSLRISTSVRMNGAVPSGTATAAADIAASSTGLAQERVSYSQGAWRDQRIRAASQRRPLHSVDGRLQPSSQLDERATAVAGERLD